MAAALIGIRLFGVEICGKETVFEDELRMLIDAPCTSGTFVRSTVTGCWALVTVVVLLNSWQSSTFENKNTIAIKAVCLIRGFPQRSVTRPATQRSSI
jgi:hypothetical protein